MPLIEKKVVHLLLTCQKRFIVFFMLFDSLIKCISIWHSSFEIISKLIYFLNCKNEFLVLVRNVNGVPLAFNIFFRDFFLIMTLILKAMQVITQTIKHLCQSLLFNKFSGLTHWFSNEIQHLNFNFGLTLINSCVLI